jgi:hypothetical protein
MSSYRPKMPIGHHAFIRHEKLSCRLANDTDLEWLTKTEQGFLYLEPIDSLEPGRYRLARANLSTSDHGNAFYWVAGAGAYDVGPGDGQGHLEYINARILSVLQSIWELYEESGAENGSSASDD